MPWAQGPAQTRANQIAHIRSYFGQLGFSPPLRFAAFGFEFITKFSSRLLRWPAEAQASVAASVGNPRVAAKVQCKAAAGRVGNPRVQAKMQCKVAAGRVGNPRVSAKVHAKL